MQSIIEKVIENKLIAIVRGVKKDKLIETAEAMYRGGIRLIEITYSANGSVSDEETAEGIRLLADNFRGRMLVGAGTVMTKRQVELTKAAGGCFIISPDTNEEIIRHTKELGLVSIPGALTPSEITAAHRAGADFVKLFPISSLGSGYVKAIKAPISNIRLLAVGGIDLDNMEEYYKVGVCGFGIGSNLANLKLIEKGDFSSIEELARSYVEKVNSF